MSETLGFHQRDSDEDFTGVTSQWDMMRAGFFFEQSLMDRYFGGYFGHHKIYVGFISREYDD